MDPKPNAYARFAEFAGDIDQEVPFGLRIRIDEESEEREAGTICILPRTRGAPLHEHLDQDEVFEVMEGELEVQVGSRKVLLHAGDRVEIPRRTPHTYFNRSTEVCVFRYSLSPGGDFTEMMRELERKGRSGKLRAMSDPRTVIHIAATIARFDRHVRSVRPPHFVMRALGALGNVL